MDFELSDEQRLLTDSARAFAARELAPHAADWDRDHHFPVEVIRRAAEQGYLALYIAEEDGGLGLSRLSSSLIFEQLAAGCVATSAYLTIHNMATWMLASFADQALKDTWLPGLISGQTLASYCLTEPDAGSDAANLRTRARRDGDHYVLDGAKQFITSGSHAGMVIVFAVTDPQAGKKGISAFIVPTDTPGFSVVRVEDKLGQHASDTCQIAFEDLRVPVANRLGEEGEGYRIALANLEGGRIGIAAQAVGMARAAFEAARDYARERETFGKPIIEHQAVAFRLADMATQIAVARQMVHHAAALREAGRPALVEASMAKLFASEMAERVCSAAIQTLGGYGYLSDFPVERIYRDVRVCQIYEGTSDIQRLVISRNLGGSD